MKKFLITAIAVLGFATVYAQDKVGDAYIGGGISFQSISCDGESETAITFTPEIGYRLSDKVGLGVTIAFGSKGSGDSKYSAFGIEPYVRHNIASLGQVSFILDYKLQYLNDGIKDNKTNTFGLGVAPGLAYNVNSKLSVVTHLGFLGYQSSKLDVEGAKAVNTFGFEANTTNIGLSVYYNF